MKTKLVRIGNSRGIHLPKPLIEQAGLEEDVHLEVQGNTVVIRALSSTRAGWAEAAADLAGTGKGLLDPGAPTACDRDEWTW
jgi:antitoxin MazE